MKQKIIFLSSVILIILFGVIYYSCRKQEVIKESNSTKSTLIKKTAIPGTGEGSSPCCEVTCRRGSCKAYTSPCNCTCIGGQPSCGGLTSGNANIITAENFQMAYYDNLAEYITNNLNNTEVADAVLAIKQLFQNNEFILNTQELVDSYYTYLAIYVDFYNNQTPEVQNTLESL